MNKRKVISVRVLFEDGEMKDYSMIDGTFLESRNGRKQYGFKNLQDWTEYVVTWVKYDEEVVEVEEPVGKVDKETLRGKAWCSQHNMEPSDCFTKHNPPTAFSGREHNWGNAVAIAKRALPSSFREPIDFDAFYKDLMEGHGNGQH